MTRQLTVKADHWQPHQFHVTGPAQGMATAGIVISESGGEEEILVDVHLGAAVIGGFAHWVVVNGIEYGGYVSILAKPSPGRAAWRYVGGHIHRSNQGAWLAGDVTDGGRKVLHAVAVEVAKQYATDIHVYTARLAQARSGLERAEVVEGAARKLLREAQEATSDARAALIRLQVAED